MNRSPRRALNPLPQPALHKRCPAQHWKLLISLWLCCLALPVQAKRPTAPPANASSILNSSEPRPHHHSRQEEQACHKRLRRHGVKFVRVRRKKARGVQYPIRLQGPVGGISIYNGNPDSPTNILDCRLALALLAWAPVLRELDIVGIRHMSMYRKGGRVATTGQPSGHAYGMAIDVGYFKMRSGAQLEILKDWGNRARGSNPCRTRMLDDAEARVLRHVTCQAAKKQIFQVILTPHYNRAHRNHLHLELKPGTEPYIH